MRRLSPNARRAVAAGSSAGCLALGADSIAHGLLQVPLLPEQAGNLVLKVLPLPVFSLLLKTFTVLARPLLLVLTTVLIIGAYALGAILASLVAPRAAMPVLAGAVLTLGGAVAVLGASPADAPTSLVVEVAILVAAVPIAFQVVGTVGDESPADADRRRLLRGLFATGVGVAVLAIGFVDVRRFVTALAMKEGDRAQTEITPVASFYVVSKNLGGDPQVDPAAWRLNLPNRALTYDELLALPAHEVELTLECISNDVGGNLISNGLWRGPRVQDLLARTAVPADAVWMLIESADGYTESFRLTELTPDHILATHLNGDVLTAAHGFPARFLFPGHYGMKQPKWVTRLRFSAQDERGYWENNGWDERAVVKTMSRIDVPQDGAQFAPGTVHVAGIAFAGNRRIAAVQVSTDGGHAWQPADLQPEFSPYAWRFWSAGIRLGSGHYGIQVRAQDGTGAIQTGNPAPTLPDGADGYHTISIDVQ
ncbi:MAG TPA: molybdopterin-dependent oxidoreductase [Candidatus Limnocylindrales bacterium]|nr:molybdopterin-dependent oxidoreductase [Candidatus Limnocylindrales bacterium]